jgi:hypothetical protein
LFVCRKLTHTPSAPERLFLGSELGTGILWPEGQASRMAQLTLFDTGCARVYNKLLMDDSIVELDAANVLEGLWLAGREACRTIWRFKPDVVLVLYHSGQSVLRAAQAVWDVVRIDPFPPVVGINFGREKTRAFRRRAEKKGMGGEDLFGFARDANLLSNWAASKTGWQAAVRDRIAAARGSADPPAHALVLDDIFDTGRTQALLEGVLSALYPGMKTAYTVAEYGPSVMDWQDALGFWVLFTCFPELGLTAEDNPYMSGSGSALGLVLERHLWRIVVGTENVDRNSLAWQPLTAGNPHVRALREHIPEAVLLELSEWVYAEIEGYARDRAMQEGLWGTPSQSTYRS